MKTSQKIELERFELEPEFFMNKDSSKIKNPAELFKQLRELCLTRISTDSKTNKRIPICTISLEVKHESLKNMQVPFKININHSQIRDIIKPKSKSGEIIDIDDTIFLLEQALKICKEDGYGL